MKTELCRGKTGLRGKWGLASLVFLSLFSTVGCSGKWYAFKPDIGYSRERGFYDKRLEFMGYLSEENAKEIKKTCIRDEDSTNLLIFLVYRF